MAYDTRLTLSNETKYTLLAASNSKTFMRLSDQFVEKLGTNRKSELQGKIGNTGVSYRKLITDYLKAL